jgi:hypothetical protein
VSVSQQRPPEEGESWASRVGAILESRAARAGGLVSLVLAPLGLVQKLSAEAVLDGIAWIVFAGAIGELGRWLVHRKLYRFAHPMDHNRRLLTFWVEVEGALTCLWFMLAIAMQVGLGPVPAGILSGLLCFAVHCVSVNILQLARVTPGLRTGTEAIEYWPRVRHLRRKLRATPLAFLDALFGPGKRGKKGKVSRFVVWITAGLVLAIGPAIAAVVQPAAWPPLRLTSLVRGPATSRGGVPPISASPKPSIEKDAAAGKCARPR